ncbi:hypothetical protein ACFFQW_25765 [Umezawaea endophytica]|uniref:Uncharacterized protein n=1 Tax=Umezawaea endophytica TaxID=1654476 RepID=A0A9X2VRD5_9PSEU|nr:hypothetical protein [Umezawaea endophytica]MCS7481465.1 hypothetical protein [Umezawaea endophytica]
MSETGLPLPPRRPLPSDARERMRRRITSAEPPVRERPNRRGPLVAAAAVVLLVAGGAVGAQLTRDSTPAVAPPPPAATSPDWMNVQLGYGKTTDADLATCGLAGIKSTHTFSMRGRRIVVGDADDAGRRRFCEITYTRVSVSLPDSSPIPVGDGAVSILWRSPSGVVVGQAPRGADAMSVDPESEPDTLDDVPRVEKLIPSDLFLLRSVAPVENVEFHVQEPPSYVTARVVKSELPGPEWSTTRDAYPSGSTAGDLPANQAARCLDLWQTDGPPYAGNVPKSFDDPADWRPTVRVGQDSAEGLLVLREEGGDTAYCTLRNGVATDLRWAVQQADVEKMFRVLGGLESPGTGVTILAGTTTSHVGELVFTSPGQAPVRAEVADGTFAVRLTGPPTTTPKHPRDFTVDVNDPDGMILYRGPAG